MIVNSTSILTLTSSFNSHISLVRNTIISPILRGRKRRHREVNNLPKVTYQQVAELGFRFRLLKPCLTKHQIVNNRWVAEKKEEITTFTFDVSKLFTSRKKCFCILTDTCVNLLIDVRTLNRVEYRKGFKDRSKSI